MTNARDLLYGLSEDAFADYTAARARLERVRAAWEAGGSLATDKGSTGQTIVHPLLAELTRLEAHVDRLRGAARLATNHWRPGAELVKLRPAAR